MSTLAERFWAKVEVCGPDECWPWTASTNPRGYGKILVEGRLRQATAVALELSGHAPIERGTDVCHRCDNPPCVNPAHLFAGSRGDNMRDYMGKVGHEHFADRRAQKITRAQAYEIRRRYGLEAVTQRALGAEYGVSQSMVALITSGQCWAP